MGTFAVSSFSATRNGSLVDESWELIDPCPDVHALFIQFNEEFFRGSLAGCEVRWSPQMTSCAGICCYEGRGGLCSIRLSTPLLKLRPRKDLVETLLHEMIHAYLFVTVNNRDRESHGPNFQEHMHRINKVAGTKITIYHSFHAEVALYKQHWWRCKGPCRDRKPFYGWVKRARNRAPGKNDLWWAEHEKTCGGEFEKVKEPEGYGEKKSSSKEKSDKSEQKPIKRGNSEEAGGSKQPKIDAFFGKGAMLGGASGSSRLLADEKDSNQASTSSGIPKNSRLLTCGTSAKVSVPVSSQPSSSTQSNPPTPRKRIIIAGFKPPEVEASSNGTLRKVVAEKEDVECPCCAKKISASNINEHLDECLSGN